MGIVVGVGAKSLVGVRLLLAEDEPLIAMNLTRMLQSAGAEVTAVGPVADGMQHANAPFDCALLDVSLADGDVFPLADALYDLGVPLVFHTGHGSGLPGLAAYGTPTALEKPAHQTEIITALLNSVAPGDAPRPT